MRILLVKLSSMGDVVHNLPVASDIRRALPDAHIEWAVEPPFVPIVALHPAVSRVIPVPLRAVKRRWWSLAAWHALFAARRRLAEGQYDLVIDTQGLMKSAWVARAAHAPIAGFDARSAREPRAARHYQHGHAIDRQQHAVERNRALAAAALGYARVGPVDYGLAIKAERKSAAPYVVFLQATSRADKAWPEPQWIALLERVAARGFRVMLPWGNAAERAASERIARAHPLAVVPPAAPLDELAALLAGARAVVGVDTGLTHLAVALGRPAIGLYVTTQPGLTGLHGRADAINLGGGTREHPAPPDTDAVWRALEPHLVTP